ncbi:glutamate 5-kinase [filamentous cyanobacterium LEGE 11480]|uniref:Glutamate 5-kinase n=1 Tax=Romeriopsis navalis LEGE 11480 TaxID=2777977 RepID=A0A928VKD2_9CYAN|nr:glutamate 5-kinase [Romeriopsis navalis]MBE9028211.1 glutamate 5-kinase [Romeriopsis navalis LEGE 11480]
MSGTIVIKIGTSSLTQPATGNLALSTIAGLVEVTSKLRHKGYSVILVSSGAVGVGCGRLHLAERPTELAMKQAVAAVGQGRLMRIYDDMFTTLQQPIAQVLLTRFDLVERSRYMNVFRTFEALLNLNVVPIVNENDTVAVHELKFGDNDTLSARVASLVDADWLFLMTDVDQLYSADPRSNPAAYAIDRVENIDQLTADVASAGTQWGTGGMLTKIEAAKIATAAGVRTVIANGRNATNILDVIAGTGISTVFEPQPRPFNARQRWLAHGLVPAGQLYLDDGAVRAVRDRGKSLLPAGIVEIDGEFESQAAVKLCDRQGAEIARGLVNYSSADLQQILGQKTDAIPGILGYAGTETIVHRDNLVLSSTA